MKHFRELVALLLAALLLCGCGGISGEQAIQAGLDVVEAILTETEEAPKAIPTEAQTPPSQAPPQTEEAPQETEAPEETEAALLLEDGSFTSKEEVALYLIQYGRLPSNFITKRQAQNLGWQGGDLHRFAPGKSIGGDRFGNYEGLLPEEHAYKECDIDYHGGSRGGKRLVFSDDGLIYYTGDHYESFTLLYGEEEP